MKVLFDINVLLDVFQKRDAFYEASAAVLSVAIRGECQGVVPGHAVTTLHYLLSRYTDKRTADESVDFLLDHFAVLNATEAVFRQARQLPMKDFEDAVVASIAVSADCRYVVTRNIADFKQSPVEALLPAEFLENLQTDDE